MRRTRPFALIFVSAAALVSCGGRTSSGNEVGASTAGAGGAAGVGAAGASSAASSAVVGVGGSAVAGVGGSSVVGVGGSSSSGGRAGQAGAATYVDAGGCPIGGQSRCSFGLGALYSGPPGPPPAGLPARPCRPFNPIPPITATGSSVLSRIAQFLENAPSVVSSTDVPAVATREWASAEAMAILDRHVADNQAPRGFARFLSFWLAAPPSVGSLSDAQGWPLRISAPGANLAGILTHVADDPRRVGILTDQGLLTAHPGISVRGVWLFQNVLCQAFPPPPSSTNHLPPLVDDPSLTRREWQSLVVSGPGCRSCHQIADGLGVSFEHFDEAGSYRTLDNGKPVDSSGTFDGAGTDLGLIRFSSIDDLTPQLANSCDVARCFAANMFSDALGAGPVVGGMPPYSGDELDYVANRFADSNFSVRALVKAIVESPTFLK